MPSQTAPLEVAIFSYNRGAHLANCLESVHQYMPGTPVVIIDDDSDDPATVRTLATIEAAGTATVHRIRSRGVTGGPSGLNGGLHENIRAYLLNVATAGIALLLQDDTQIVRPVTAADLRCIQRSYATWPAAVVMLPVFLTHNSYEEEVDPASVSDPDTIAFNATYEYAGYFDVCLIEVTRLRRMPITLGDERQTAANALQAYGPMRIMRRPFVGHLPLTPCFRYRQRTYVQRVCEFRRVGLYPIAPLSDAKARDLQRNAHVLATAERYLDCPTLNRGHPWPNTWHEDVPLALTRLENLEVRLRHWRRHSRVARRQTALRSPTEDDHPHARHGERSRGEAATQGHVV